MRRLLCACGLSLALTACAESAHGQYAFELIAEQLGDPVYVTHAPGDDNTLYILEQRGINPDTGRRSGQVVALDLTSRERRPFLSIDDAGGGEGGLKGLAFHPDFATNGRLYVSWVEAIFGRSESRLDEYVVQRDSGAVAHSRLLYREPAFTIEHLINWIGFDPTASGAARNHLYVTLGDNGGQATQPGYVNVSQDLSNTFGKVLRVDVNPDAPDAYPDATDRNYAIPPDNPYLGDGDDSTLGEVFHSGLRNTWRASFDRATGDMYIGNVGHRSREEIEFARAGESGIDFGWARREGTIETPAPGIGGPQGDSRNPIYEYNHIVGASVIGGFVYRGPVDSIAGSYFFADYTSRKLWMGEFDRNTDPATFNGNLLANVREVPQALMSAASGRAVGGITSFGEDNAGNLYVVDSGRFGDGGYILRLVDALSGDFSGDGVVDQLDLGLALTNWGESGDDIHRAWLVNRPTGVVDQVELDRVLANWGDTYGSVTPAATSVPEPNPILMLTAILPCLWLLLRGQTKASLATCRARIQKRRGAARNAEPLSYCLGQRSF